MRPGGPEDPRGALPSGKRGVRHHAGGRSFNCGCGRMTPRSPKVQTAATFLRTHPGTNEIWRSRARKSVSIGVTLGNDQARRWATN
jgi:hypothetical protein